MRFTQFTGAALLAFASIATSIQFDPESQDSIRAATKQYAAGLMALYKGGAPGTAQQDIGIWPAPHYWWEGGAAWGGEFGCAGGMALYTDYISRYDRVQHVYRR